MEGFHNNNAIRFSKLEKCHFKIDDLDHESYSPCKLLNCYSKCSLQPSSCSTIISKAYPIIEANFQPQNDNLDYHGNCKYVLWIIYWKIFWKNLVDALKMPHKIQKIEISLNYLCLRRMICNFLTRCMLMSGWTESTIIL